MAYMTNTTGYDQPEQSIESQIHQAFTQLPAENRIHVLQALLEFSHANAWERIKELEREMESAHNHLKRLPSIDLVEPAEETLRRYTQTPSPMDRYGR